MTSSEILAWFLQSHHSLSLSDVTPTATRGYWRVIKGCRGDMECKHAFRSVMGPCDGSTELTIHFSEHGFRDRKGRWVRPYRVWEEMRNIGGPAIV